jgi:hypothetical protein
MPWDGAWNPPCLAFMDTKLLLLLLLLLLRMCS